MKRGTDIVKPVPKPETIVKSLAIGTPADGYYAIHAMKQTGGTAEDVTDEEVVEGIRLLAECEGIFAETAGGVTVACAKKLIDSGNIPRDESAVLCITGHGLKTQEAIIGKCGEPRLIKPSLREFEEQIYNAGRRARLTAPDTRPHQSSTFTNPHLPMPTVRIPTPLRKLTNELEVVAGRRRQHRRNPRQPRPGLSRPERAHLRRAGQRPPLRERLRERRGHPLPRRESDRRQRQRRNQHRPRHRRRLERRTAHPSLTAPLTPLFLMATENSRLWLMFPRSSSPAPSSGNWARNSKSSPTSARPASPTRSASSRSRSKASARRSRKPSPGWRNSA